jgi:hopanoid biosynthesis associated radical SAM protein HpnH
VRQRLAGRKRYPLVLMLEPLFRCNLACGGCGKIQHPVEVLRKHLSPEQCFAAVDECGAPVVAIPAANRCCIRRSRDRRGLIARKKFVYLCTNAIRLERASISSRRRYFSFSVHLDGPREEHDRGRARRASSTSRSRRSRPPRRAASASPRTRRSFDAAPQRVHEFFDFVTDELKVDGMMISPGYPYEKAPDQDHFLASKRRVAVPRDHRAV